MNDFFESKLNTLKKTLHLFDQENNAKRISSLKEVSKIKFTENKNILKYYELLLFICAYPSDKKILKIAERELNKVTAYFQNTREVNVIFRNAGLPFTPTVAGFSHDLLNWLIQQGFCKMQINGFKDSLFSVGEALRFTLPSLEREEASAGHTNESIFDALKIREDKRLSFLISEFNRLNHIPFIKDQLFDGMGLSVKITPSKKSFSKAYNRFRKETIFYQDELFRRFDPEKLFEKKLPNAEGLTINEKNNLVITIINSLILGARETDTATYMDPASLKYFVLERGIAIAVYGMVPNRQLPLESYVGFTLFKNGFPTAYGGGWVFGRRALFGINISETFRGGESGYVMCQLLRVYKQVFGISFFEVEPYQYGYENPEGIESGAFWFYYRYGFRPTDKKLLLLSEREHRKIISTKGYRSSSKTLIKFTESNIALNLGKGKPAQVSEITAKLTNLIKNKYGSNRIKAEEDCVKSFIAKAGVLKIKNENEEQVLKEVAFWSETLKVDQPEKINILAQMIKAKPKDLYKYQQLILQFFDDRNSTL